MPKSKGRKKKPQKKRDRKTRYPFVPATEDKYISIDDGPVTFVSKITGTIQNEDTQTLTVKGIPIEDSIRPVELKFRPPLQQDGTGSSSSKR
uniref:hypothetical protein n=1 Tax=Gordonia sp. B7-2 TaxID=3420932 RepID=UPI003D8D5366